MTAFDYLSRRRKYLPSDYDIVLFDKKESFDFLPLVPDVLAGWMHPERISIKLSKYIKDKQGKFIKARVRNIKTKNNLIEFKAKELQYEYLLLCPGGETNFFGNQNAKENSMVLNSRKNALDIKNNLLKKSKNKKFLNVIVVGAGYTGLEAAFNAHFLLKQSQRPFKITVVEKAPKILGMVEESIQKEAQKELNKHNIEVLTGESLKECQDDSAILASGKRIENVVCIWSAGVKAPDCLECFDAEKIKNRIKVNQDLTISGKDYKNIFVAGDSAAFIDSKTDKPLRMAIMFAMGEGKTASQNIINSIGNKKLENYNPIDLGYLIPLVYGKAPGQLFGKYKVNSRIGYLLHYLLSAYRSKPYKIPGILHDILFSRILNIK